VARQFMGKTIKQQATGSQNGCFYKNYILQRQQVNHFGAAQ
jgi:hypothetical protein